MELHNEDIRSQFYSGNLQSARALGESPAALESAPWVLGALAQSGRVPEAELFYIRMAPNMHPAAHVRSLYYLAHACAQRGRYTDARRFIGRLFSYRREARDDASRAHLRLAIGWLRFSMGRLRQALWHGEAALVAASRVGCSYLSFVTNDLLGHARCLAGDPRRGLPALRSALESARRLGRDSALPRLAVSIAVHRSKWAEGAIDTDELQRLSEQAIDPALTASLALEIARRHAEDGDVDSAENALQTAARSIGGASSRRYMATYLLRKADVALSRRDPASAHILLESARRWLDPEVDAVIETEVVHRLLIASERRAGLGDAEALQDEFRRLVRLFGVSVTPVPKPRTVQDSQASAPEVPTGGALWESLNARHITLLRAMRKGEWVGVQDYSARFDVSLITAYRDLSYLCRIGFFKRHGKARATRYALVKSLPSPEKDAGVSIS